MASLVFDHTYEGTVSKQLTVTVLGETRAEREGLDDEVEVLVTAAQLNALLSMTYHEADGVDTDERPKPALTFSLDGMSDQIEAAPVSSVEAVLASTNFPAEGEHYWLSQIPHEAIKSIEPGAPVWAYGDLFSPVVSNDRSSGPKPLAVQNLFEQVVAAGRLSNDGESTTFVVGDKVTVYIDYDVTKSRLYTLDGKSPGATAQAKFTIGGTEKTLTNTDIEIFSSDSGVKKIAYQLIVASDAAVAQVATDAAAAAAAAATEAAADESDRVAARDADAADADAAAADETAAAAGKVADAQAARAPPA